MNFLPVIMMVVKNHHWLPDESKAGFIANGDIVESLKVGSVREQYGFRFADVSMRMVYYPMNSRLKKTVLPLLRSPLKHPR